MRAPLFSAVFASAFALLAGCGGGFHPEDITTRNRDADACEARPENDRTACYEAMPHVGGGEPSDDTCRIHDEEHGWLSNREPDACMVSAIFCTPEGLDAKLGTGSKVPTREQVRAFAKACDEELARLDEGSRCLRTFTSNKEGVGGISRGCFVRLAREKDKVREAHARIEPLVAKDKEAEKREQAEAQARRVEEDRAGLEDEALKVVENSCNGAWLTQTKTCDGDPVSPARRDECRARCTKAGFAGYASARKKAEEACVAAWEPGKANAALAACTVTAPKDAQIPADRIKADDKACAKTCAAQGPAAAKQRAAAAKFAADHEKFCKTHPTGPNCGTPATGDKK